MKFEELNLKPNLLKAIQAMGYTDMTPIQEQTIPHVIMKEDVIAQAPTGTGKTCAFAIPAIQEIDESSTYPQVLVLLPTRELAIQVTGEFRKLLQYTDGIKCLAIYGGQNIELQLRALRNHPQIIVGTPGRIIDHIKRRTLDLSRINTLVLDEADEMLDMGFQEDLHEILSNVESEHHTLLFSATVPAEILKISKKFQKNAIHIQTTFENKEIPAIEQYYVELLEKNKTDCLSRMIDVYSFREALVFCRTKRQVDELSMSLVSRGYKVECLHGDMRQESRDRVMKMFREGLVRVLIATDVAARGLDIEGIDVVFNYDITDDCEYYIHRIGRTARAGRTGAAYTFVNPKEVRRIQEFSRKINAPIVKVDPPTFELARTSRIRHEIKSHMENIQIESLKPYLSFIEEAITEEEEWTPELLIASFLQEAIRVNGNRGDEGRDLSVLRSTSQTPKDATRLFINVGVKDNFKRSSFIDWVTENVKDISSDQVMNVQILDTFSFFEVPNTKKDAVVTSLKNLDCHGRFVDCEVAGGKKENKENNHKRGRASSRRHSEDFIKRVNQKKNDRFVTDKTSEDSKSDSTESGDASVRVRRTFRPEGAMKSSNDRTYSNNGPSRDYSSRKRQYKDESSSFRGASKDRSYSKREDSKSSSNREYKSNRTNDKKNFATSKKSVTTSMSHRKRKEARDNGGVESSTKRGKRVNIDW